jgi:cytoskeletal protein CcmA (bactofilin family)
MFAKKDSETISVNGKGSQIKTLISEGCKFEGSLYSPSYTRIDGEVLGNVSGQSGIVLGEKGVVHGDIKAVEVILCGRVKGNIVSQDLYVKSTGSVNGDVTVESLVTEKGGVINGRCIMGKKDDLED